MACSWSYPFKIQIAQACESAPLQPGDGRWKEDGLGEGRIFNATVMV